MAAGGSSPPAGLSGTTPTLTGASKAKDVRGPDDKRDTRDVRGPGDKADPAAASRSVR
jgi:hypothetical protein